MRQWYIKNDKIHDLGVEVPYLGIPYDQIKNNNIETLPENYDGWFPFMRMCYSIGDLAIISGIFEALKTKYPKIKIAWPSNEYIDHILGEGYISRWDYNKDVTAKTNIETIIGNNPHIDKIFNVGDFDLIFTDHDRSYTSLIHDGEMVRSCDEPLAEQILRRFGFTDEDIKNIDSKPKVYFTDEEIDKCNNIIEEHIGNFDYGCLLFAGRLEQFKGRWENDYLLFNDAKKFSNTPVFVYSQYDLNNTEWDNFFPNRISFAELGLSIREQIYIKQKSKFNIGYQGGVTEASSGGTSKMVSLCPYKTIRENCVRGSKYIFFNKTSKVI
tara:strand:- start:252 stop:1229 length:978 start_codon:yes stop_codon:yes gene_type:complete